MQSRLKASLAELSSGQREAGAHLNALGSQRERRQHAPARGDAARRDQRNRNRCAHLRNQRHRRRLLAAVVPARFESLGDDRIDTRFLTFQGEFRARHHVRDLAACGMQLPVHVFGLPAEVNTAGTRSSMTTCMICSA